MFEALDTVESVEDEEWMSRYAGSDNWVSVGSPRLVSMRLVACRASCVYALGGARVFRA